MRPLSDRPLRSVLYMPGANSRALEKARDLPADAVILDLEDSVSPDAKRTARDQIALAVRQGGYGHRTLAIRINARGTAWFSDDIRMAATSGADVVVLPKTESAEDIERTSDALRQAGAPSDQALWAMIETPLAILRLPEISSAKRHARSRLAGLIVGLNDLAKETRIELDLNRTPALPWLSMTVLAARAYGLTVLDSAYNNFRDPDGLARECRQGRMLGFDGKTLIHPDQISTANTTFSPDPAEVAWSRKIIAAFSEPSNADKGVINLDGKMVELLHLETAKRVVTMDAAIRRSTNADGR